MVADLTRHRRAFWAFFATRLPDLAARTRRGNETTRWLAVGPRPLVLAHYVSAGGVGLFVRGPRGERSGHVREFLFPHRDLLAARLGRPGLRLGSRFLLDERLAADMADEAGWPGAVAWLGARSAVYEQALAELQAPVRGRSPPFR